MNTHRTALRDRYNAFIERHEVAWELGMGALAVLFVAIGFMGDDASPAMVPVLDALDIGLTAIFVAEFGTRFAASRDRRRYLRSHWIDLVALIPTTRGARLLRLLRLLRLIRTFAGVYRALTSVERLANHKGLVWLFSAWLGVAVISAAALYVAEAGINPNIDEPIDALWWGVVTLTTVGYGDVYPVTPEGRLAGAALMILGITLFAAITGTITSFLITGESSAEARSVDRLRAVEALRADGLLTAEEYEAKREEIVALL